MPQTNRTSHRDPPPADQLGRRHRRVGLYAATAALTMLAMAYAAVPLYRIFCQTTGFAGTPRAATQASAVILDRTITVRLDANVAPGLAWTVLPLEATQTVRYGETAVAYFRATNVSGHAIVGTSSFNVSPDQSGGYFNKLECFCFTEQRLEAGQTLDMGVRYFVDPAMAAEPDTRAIRQITLSYTFYPVDHPKASAVTVAPAPKGT